MKIPKINAKILDPFLTKKSVEISSKTYLFHFQPFEIDSEFDGKPHAFTKAFWDGKEREFALALVDGWVRFCEVDQLESGEWNFAVSGYDYHSPQLKINPRFVEHVFELGLKEGKIGRLFRFEANEFDTDGYEVRPLWVFVGLNGQCALVKSGVETPFVRDIPLSVTENSACEWHVEILNWLEEIDTDFGFSFRWSGLQENEKAWMVAQLENGTRSEMESVASDILSLNEDFLARASAEEASHIFVKIKLGIWGESATIDSVFFKDYYDEETYQGDVSPILGDILLRHFEPQVNLEICKRYTAPDRDDVYYLTFSAKTREMTAHERIEIRVRLNNWLQGKIPDDQIDSLLA